MAPITIVVIVAWQNIPVNIFFGQATLICCDLYGTVNALITIYFVKPYRIYVIQVYRKLLEIVSCGRFKYDETLVQQLRPEATISLVSR